VVELDGELNITPTIGPAPGYEPKPTKFHQTLRSPLKRKGAAFVAGHRPRERLSRIRTFGETLACWNI
jgi:hypothetical protein